MSNLYIYLCKFSEFSIKDGKLTVQSQICTLDKILKFLCKFIEATSIFI